MSQREPRIKSLKSMCFQNALFQAVLQKVAFCVAFDGILHCKKWSFGV